MKYFWALLFYLFFLFQCKEPPLSGVKRIENQYLQHEQEIRNFPKKYNHGNFRTNDIDLIKKYFEATRNFLLFAEENHLQYKEGLEELKKQKIKHKTNKYLNYNRVTYKHSILNLENIQKMELKNIEENKNYFFHFNLSTSHIFKIPPRGVKGGGSNRYESIRKTFK